MSALCYYVYRNKNKTNKKEEENKMTNTLKQNWLNAIIGSINNAEFKEGVETILRAQSTVITDIEDIKTVKETAKKKIANIEAQAKLERKEEHH